MSFKPKVVLFLLTPNVQVPATKDHHLVSITKILYTLVGRSRVRFPMVSLEFFIYIILLAALWTWVDSASNRNEYQEYFLGVKAAGA
jgi:hypothetical protein